MTTLEEDVAELLRNYTEGLARAWDEQPKGRLFSGSEVAKLLRESKEEITVERLYEAQRNGKEQ